MRRSRAFLRTRVPPVARAYQKFLFAICTEAPNDCASIPKVKDAGALVHAHDGGVAYQVMHNGIKVRLNSYYGDLNTDIISHLKGHHEPQEERVFYEVLNSLPQDICMIEAGSYWGYYSMWAQREKRRVRNILIEPVDDHARVGFDNFALNGMHAEFIRAYVGATSESPHTKKFENEAIADLERISIDDLMKRVDIEFAHIVHADIQGAEDDLLAGAIESVRASRIGYFFISTHGHDVHARCRAFLQEHEFRIVAEHSRSESFTTDGLIVARAREYPGLDSVSIQKSSNWKSGVAVLRHFVRSVRSAVGRANRAKAGADCDF